MRSSLDGMGGAGLGRARTNLNNIGDALERTPPFDRWAREFDRFAAGMERGGGKFDVFGSFKTDTLDRGKRGMGQNSAPPAVAGRLSTMTGATGAFALKITAWLTSRPVLPEPLTRGFAGMKRTYRRGERVQHAGGKHDRFIRRILSNREKGGRFPGRIGKFHEFPSRIILICRHRL